MFCGADAVVTCYRIDRWRGWRNQINEDVALGHEGFIAGLVNNLGGYLHGVIAWQGSAVGHAPVPIGGNLSFLFNGPPADHHSRTRLCTAADDHSLGFGEINLVVLSHHVEGWQIGVNSINDNRLGIGEDRTGRYTKSKVHAHLYGACRVAAFLELKGPKVRVPSGRHALRIPGLATI